MMQNGWAMKKAYGGIFSFISQLIDNDIITKHPAVFRYYYCS